MGHQAQKLRALLDSGEHFVAADAYSALTARIVEKVGFKAAYLGGHACSAFHYAIPDNGAFPQVEQIDQAARIVAAIDIPLIADADTLGETVADAYYLTRRYEQAGVAGFHVEDEVNPKHSSYVNGLCPIPEMQARLDAVSRARIDPAFVIVARCDELYPSAWRGGGGGSLEEAIKRGLAYVEAGADALTFPLASAEATAALVKALPVPIMAMGAVDRRAAATLSTGWGFLGAAQTHLARAQDLFDKDAVEFDPTFEIKDALIDQALYDGLITDWARRTGRATR
jgi:2-methylisocitrate lyase-like PEP mutase family enzyme